MSAQTDSGSRAHTVRALTGDHAHERGPLLVVLHAVQAEFGYIDSADVPVIARELNLSVAEVHGVISFYTDFRTNPAPAHTIGVCRGEACQAVGAQQMFEAATTEIGSRADVEVAEVFCFGNCALGPTATVDGRLHGRLTMERLTQLTDQW